MTHKDIYTKFMIEYDKANVTSSYPSLTEYEVATILDKAYHALISLKFTGNNVRRAPFEADTKAVHDLEPLIAHTDQKLFNNGHVPAVNIVQYNLPPDCMYLVSSQLNYQASDNTQDGLDKRLLPVRLVPHSVAERFFTTQYNMPWVKNPVQYIEGGVGYVVYDSLNKPLVSNTDTIHVSYIKEPKKFVDSVDVVLPTDPDNPNTGDDDPEDSASFALDISKLDNKTELIK